MIKRAISRELLTLLNEYPVVTVLGPRQAGKTTLVKDVLKGYEYSNLESPEVRDVAMHDPKGYLAQFSSGVIIDEIQRVPELLSYIQVQVDSEKENGRFVLTGSHQPHVRAAVSQSLAGRTGILHLLPFSITELSDANMMFNSFEEYAFRGFLPRIYDQSIRPTTAYSNYYQTYVERDVSQLTQLKNSSLFEKMMKLLAGRVGQLMDYSSLANDVGVDAKTIKNWIAILEASFLLFKLPPFYDNFGKRMIKSPKYYFTDVGLLCFLLGLRSPEQVTRDPLVGNIFENLVVIEVLKARYNRGLMSDLYFSRDAKGHEVDLVLAEGRHLRIAEIKSSSTFSSNFMKELQRFRQLAEDVQLCSIIYNGEPQLLSHGIQVLNYQQASQMIG